MRDYIIGSFNIRHLNYESDKDVKKDFDKLAKIIEKEKFDVIAIQEALSDSAIKHLKGILGENTWDARWSQSDKHDKKREGYAFIWNKRVLRLVENERNNNPRVMAGVNIRKDLRMSGCVEPVRPPYVGEFTPQGGIIRGSNFSFRLINTHIAFSKPDYVGGEIGALLARRNELRVLSEEIYRRVSRTPGGELVPYTFLMGDYNLCLAASHDRMSALIPIEKGRTLKTVQSELTTLKQPKSVALKEEEKDRKFFFFKEGSTDYYASDYDHFSYETELDEKLHLEVSRVDTLKDYCKNDIEKHWNTISDHVPIKLKISFK